MVKRFGAILGLDETSMSVTRRTSSFGWREALDHFEISSCVGSSCLLSIVKYRSQRRPLRIYHYRDEYTRLENPYITLATGCFSDPANGDPTLTFRRYIIPWDAILWSTITLAWTQRQSGFHLIHSHELVNLTCSFCFARKKSGGGRKALE